MQLKQITFHALMHTHVMEDMKNSTADLLDNIFKYIPSTT